MKSSFNLIKDDFLPILNGNKKLFFIREKKEESKFNIQMRVLNNYLHVPVNRINVARHIAYALNIPPIQEYVNLPITMRVDNPVQINEYQQILMDKILTEHISKDNNKKGISTCLLQMNTGLGKTRIGVKLIENLLVKTLIVVPTKHIATQWIEEIGDRFTTCIYENKLNIFSSDITICIINTARDKNVEFYSNFVLVILDEVHEYTSTKNKHVLWRSSSVPYILGLTATPDKGDNLLSFIEAHLGKTLYTSEVIDVEKISHRWVAYVRIFKYTCPSKFSIPVLNVNGDVCSMSSLNRIIEDDKRMNLIINEIKYVYDLHDTKNAKQFGLVDENGNILHKHNIYVFAETRDMLTSIKDKLSGYDVEIEDDISVLKGGVTTEVIKDAECRRIILTTYGYSRRGVSYNKYTALIFATSRNAKYSIEQVIGRIFRFRGPKTVVRHIAYIWDSNTVFKKHIKNHTEVYDKFGYKHSVIEC